MSTSFCEVTANFSAYSVLDHRHVPEILMTSRLEEGELSFTAHLLPIDRGILETIYFRARNIKRGPTCSKSTASATRTRDSFVCTSPAALPDIRGVDRTNFCDIGVRFDPASGRAVMVSAIDNLVKGAAGQAIQNMNLMLGLRGDGRVCCEGSHQDRWHFARFARIAGTAWPLKSALRSRLA